MSYRPIYDCLIFVLLLVASLLCYTSPGIVLSASSVHQLLGEPGERNGNIITCRLITIGGAPGGRTPYFRRRVFITAFH